MTFVMVTKDVIEDLIEEIEVVRVLTELPVARRMLTGILMSLRSLQDVAVADWRVSDE